MTGEPWHALLAPLPGGLMPRRKPVASPEILATAHGASIAGWEQLSIELSAGAAGMRIVLVVVDAAGQLLSGSDTVLYSSDPQPGSFRQETIGGRFEPDGTFRGTRWRTSGVETGDDENPRLESTPSPPTDAEIAGIKALVADVLRRASLSVPSPDGRHHARLTQAGEIRFGPVYYRLAIDDVELPDRIFGDSLRWSDDSRLLAAQEWRTTDYLRGPTTRVALFDPERRRHAVLADVRAGFVEHFVFAGPALTYRARFYTAGTTQAASVTLASIDGWEPY